MDITQYKVEKNVYIHTHTKLSPRINFGCLGRKMLRRDDNVLQSYEIVIYFLK
jgi:hypothetical protein